MKYYFHKRHIYMTLYLIIIRVVYTYKTINLIDTIRYIFSLSIIIYHIYIITSNNHITKLLIVLI